MKKAFTLVELIVSLGMFAMLFTVISEVLGGILSARVRSEADSELAGETSWIFSRMGYDVARASAITIPVAGETGEELGLTIGGVAYSYKVVDEQLLFGVSGNEESIVDEDVRVTNLTVTRMQDLFGKANVQINMTLVSTSQIAGGVVPTRQIVTTYAIR